MTAPTRPPAELPRWLSGRVVLATGLVIALGVVAAALGFVAYERRELRDEADHRGRLFARVLEDHVNRTFDALDLALGAAADRLAADQQDGSGALRAAPLQAMPFLRSLSLLDTEGRVLASTGADNLGRQVPLDRLRGAAPAGLGPLVPWRDLAQLADSEQGPAAAVAPAAPVAGPSFVPLLRPLPDGRVLLAAVNVDFFANHYALLLADEPLRVALLAYDGTLLAASGRDVPRGAGRPLAGHRIFQDALPARDRGEVDGNGLDGRPALIVYRSARREPLAVLIETPLAVIDDEVAQIAGRALGAAGGAALLLLAVSGLAWRSLRGHAAARDDLAEARGTLAARDAFTDRLFQVSPIPMVVKDTDGRIGRVNQAWCAFTGIAESRAVGCTLGQLYPPQLAAPHEVQEQMAINAARPTSYEEQVLDADGLPRDVRVRVVPYADAGGRVAGVIVCLMDVTEFREAEVRTLEAKEAAERANAAKTDFLANISHELRTPLQTIIGFSELGITRGGHEPRLQGMFRDVHRAGERMLALVNNLLDLSRFDSTMGDVDPQRQDLAPLVREVAHELRELAARRGLTLKLEGSADAPLWADVDAARLQQVLRNLIANALRFAPEHSTVDIAWRAGPPGAEHRLTVRDRGPGVPDAELEAIFEPFVQSSRTRSAAGGTGLGLAICRRIMVAHHGSVRARTHPDGGAEFELRLPAVAPQAITAAG